MKSSLSSIWSYALSQVSPEALIRKQGIRQKIPRSSAILFWGKAARATSDAVASQGPRLIISPENGDHPLPGKRSFEAGDLILEFFDSLGDRSIRLLTVFLSGGASSLAWIKPGGMSTSNLLSKLRLLYRRPLTIQQLNRERSKLCGLKAGGAGKWLKLFAPKIQTQVYVISDVAPFGAEVVGSGPFSETKIPHKVLADNSTLVNETRKAVRKLSPGERILDCQHSSLGSEKKWATSLAHKIRVALKEKREGVFILGGEPQVKLPSRAGRGGRQCQIAARLALLFWEEIRQGRVEILCASSDGSDGNSGAAAIYLNRALPPFSRPLPKSLQRRLKKAIASFNAAPFLRAQGALIPSPQRRRGTGTNLQDLIMVRVRL